MSIASFHSFLSLLSGKYGLVAVVPSGVLDIAEVGRPGEPLICRVGGVPSKCPDERILCCRIRVHES